MVLSLGLLNLTGCDCVDDLRILERDEGFYRVLERVETHGMGGKEWRWSKGRRPRYRRRHQCFGIYHGFMGRRRGIGNPSATD
jgi:hypothetical protein